MRSISRRTPGAYAEGLAPVGLAASQHKITGDRPVCELPVVVETANEAHTVVAGCAGTIVSARWNGNLSADFIGSDMTPTNEPPYVLGIDTDVTEQRRNDDRARMQSRLLEKFFESTLTCAVLLDKGFNFIRVNDAYAKACRRPASEFPGRNHFDLYPSDARPIFEEVVRTGRPYVAEAHPFVFPGHPEWGVTHWDWTLVPVLGDHGEVDLLLFCLNDVTERRRAEQRLQEAMNQLRGLSQQLVDIQEQERRRIARELHDQMGQELTALKLLLENSVATEKAVGSSRLSEALAVTNGLMESVRRISFDLRPAMLDDLGLLAALVWLIDRHRAHTGIDVSFRHNSLDQRLPPEIETAAYRITQEALTNVARHANVRQAEVAVWVTPDAVVLRIMDQGRGFDPGTATHSGSGLLGMQERVMSLGGNLTVDASVGGGTTIIAEIPCNFIDAVQRARQ